MDFRAHLQKQTEHKLHSKHVCSPCGSPQGSEVTTEHTGTLLEAHSGWMLPVSAFFIYLNSVRTSHLPSFLFNLQETKKNTSGFLCCVDPVMCRAVPPSCILLLIVEVEMSAELCRTLPAHSLTQNVTPTAPGCNYHPGSQPCTCVRSLHTSHHYLTTCEKWAWAITTADNTAASAQTIWDSLAWFSLLVQPKQNKPMTSVWKILHFPAVY